MSFENLITHFSTRGLRINDIQRYLDEGGDVNQKGSEGWTLLHYAAEDQNIEVIRLLVSRGADLNAKDDDGWTPLHYAVDMDLDTSPRQGRRATELPTAKALIELGADESIESNAGERPRDIAVAYGETALYDAISLSSGGP